MANERNSPVDDVEALQRYRDVTANQPPSQRDGALRDLLKSTVNVGLVALDLLAENPPRVLPDDADARAVIAGYVRAGVLFAHHHQHTIKNIPQATTRDP